MLADVTTGTSGTTGTSRLVIDAVMPDFDVAIAEHQLVRASPASTYQAARDLDFLSVRTPLLDAAMWMRGVPSRLAGRSVDPPPRLVLGDSEGLALPGWSLLGEQPGREIAFGAVGKFWQPNIEWRDVPASEFAGFGEPGWGKIAANFAVVPYGEHSTLLTYECRTATTDAQSRARFSRYWFVIRPFVAHILRATLRTIRDNAERDEQPVRSGAT